MCLSLGSEGACHNGTFPPARSPRRAIFADAGSFRWLCRPRFLLPPEPVEMAMSRAVLTHPFMHLAVVAVAAAVWLVIAIGPGHSHELPLQSIVGGHRLQPNEKQLNTLGQPDVSTSGSAEIDKLYGILLHCAASACTARDNGPLSRP